MIWSSCRFQGTGSLALGAGLMVAKKFELRARHLLKDPLEDRLGDLDGRGLRGIEIDVEPRPLVAEGPARNNSSPAVHVVAQFRQILGVSSGEWHLLFVLELVERGKMEKAA